jgi:hypothetical protein
MVTPSLLRSGTTPKATMAINIATNSKLTDEELAALLAAAQGNSDRRVDPRHAFFTTVTLRPASSPTTAISAFSREISVSGIGLLHATPLAAGQDYELDIRIEDVRIRKSVRAVWCRAVGEGWYLSGCRFV